MGKYLTKKDFELLDVNTLDNNKKDAIIAIKEKTNLSYECTLNFGSEASAKLREFSNNLLKSTKLKDSPEVGGILTDLMGELEKVDSNTLLSYKPTFFKKLFKIDDLKNFISKYDDVASVIDDIKQKLESVQYELLKDVELCDKHLMQNERYINELDNYIYAGKLIYQEENNKIEEELMNIDKDDVLAVNELNQKQNALNRLSRKLYDLELIKANAVQNIPQINLIKEGDAAIIEKIQTSINTAIPLWETQMVIAITLVRQRNGIDIQKSVTDTTNRLLSINGELLKAGSIDIAKEVQKGVIDIEVLKNNNKQLIETFKEIKKITLQGEETREKALLELGMLQSSLNDTLLIEEKDNYTTYK